MSQTILVLRGMATVLVAGGFWFAAFCGWGSLLHRGLSKAWPESDESGVSFWLGLASVTVLLQLWHFLLPVDWRASAFVLAVGLGTLAFCRSLRIARPPSEVRAFFFVAAPFALWLAYRATLPPFNYDSGLYHFSAIRWINTFPLVPGLGNLHHRLAFNQSYFLFPALLNVSPFFQHGWNIFNPLLVAVAAGQFLWAAIELWFRRKPEPALFFQTAAFPVVLHYAARSNNISSPSPDLAIFIFGLILTAELIALLFPTPTGARVQSKFFFLLTIAALAVTFKLSVAVFGITLCVMAVWIFLRTREIPTRGKWSSLAASGVAGFLLIVPWMGSGVVTSGYPLYPGAIVPFAVDWRIPPSDVAVARRKIIAFGREPGANPDLVLANSDWIQPWFKSMAREQEIVLPAWLALVFPVAAALLWWKKGFRPGWFLPLVPGASWIVYWFFSSPNPRFIGSAVWILGLWAVTLLALALCAFMGRSQTTRADAQLSRAQKRKTSARADVKRGPVRDGICSPVCMTVAAVAGLLAMGCLVKTAPDINRREDGFCAIPQAFLHVWLTPSRLGVFLPTRGDQTWDAPLPASTPKQATETLGRIQLRGPALRSGFREEPESPSATLRQ